MNKIEEITVGFNKLDESKKVMLLSHLLFYFSQKAKSSYIETGNTQDSFVSHLRMYNEMIQSISDRFLFYIEATPNEKTYSTESFFKSLKGSFEKAIKDEELFFSIIHEGFKENK